MTRGDLALLIVPILFGAIVWITIKIIDWFIEWVKKTFQNFDEYLKKQIGHFAKQINILHDMMTDHKDAMGKFSKAVQGDFLEFEKKLINIESSFGNRFNEVTKEMTKVQANCEMSAGKIELTIAKVTDLSRTLDQVKELAFSFENYMRDKPQAPGKFTDDDTEQTRISGKP